MRSYGCNASAITLGSTGAAVANIHNLIYNPATVLNRPQIYDIILGSGATPADMAMTFAICRTTTAAPTGGTAVTPQPMDFADAAASTLGRIGPAMATATVTAAPYILTIPMNQRVTWRWCAVPGGEILLNSAVNVGVGILGLLNNGTIPAFDSTIIFRE